MKEVESNTLGKAVKLAKKLSLFSDDIQKSLDEVVAERNWMTHRLVLDNSDDMNSNSRRPMLFQRVENVRNLAVIAKKKIVDDAERVLVSKGASAKAINETAQQDFMKSRGLA